ncbi:head morphogenesis protein [Sinorhizobium medicae]|uniref:phage minor head protein n=1 Tax=Sinorhizobium medicae TaxID=110321 RepID=UPI000C7CBC12|nr:phage minor head protein [Sinorhizobium medicae]MDX0605220.1 head morphogenesis protein [Sinorhizobium medicae]MDX0821516.1 head morphogenesis protein [Sinorhizobium medicae]MDX0864581.1 head morphogenesis protein [Sinorhizobium medicae]MDX0886146.1 head morphogenesis protein [Sinorhizobium medicae]MDX0980281.1 head morphogenesis protein [Sinorhizobium medicae]
MTLDELLSTYEPRLAAAFREAIETIKSTAVLARVVERLDRSDVNGAVEAMQIEPEAFSALEIALQEAFNAGGTNAVGELPKVMDPQGNRVIWRFGVRNPTAEAILRDLSSTMVMHITVDQQQGIRQALEQGLARGANPRSTALDVVGRQSRVTGRREGGVIGLTRYQIEFIERARVHLASGDPELMNRYFELKTRDKRFDRTVVAAIRAGKPVTGETLTKIVGRLRDKNLLLRGEMLARTETMMALSSARDEAMRQQIEAGKVQAQDVTKVWRSAGDSRVRHTHRVLSGKSVRMDEVFQSPSGALLRFPGDPRAPISEISGCRCRLEYRVDHIGAVVRRYRAEVV